MTLVIPNSKVSSMEDEKVIKRRGCKGSAGGQMLMGRPHRDILETLGHWEHSLGTLRGGLVCVNLEV